MFTALFPPLTASTHGLFGALGPLLGGLMATLLPVPAPTPGLDLLSGLKGLFVVSAVLRLGAWGLLHRIPAPKRPRRRAVALIRSAVRSFNPGQGLGPLLHIFSSSRDET
jgi:hypothetical protein